MSSVIDGSDNVGTAELSNLEAIFSGFISSTASEGYVSLGNGMLLQWGTSSMSSGGVPVTFATEFPTACLHVMSCAGGTSSVATTADQSTVTTTGYTAKASSTVTGKWLAIGY